MQPFKSQLIAGEYERGGGRAVEARNPAHPAAVAFAWHESTPADIERALLAARGASATWRDWGFDRRARVLHAVAELASARVDDLAKLIREETGKPAWDAKAEAGLIAAKIGITLDAAPGSPLSRVTGAEFSLGGTKWARTRFHPHGVMAVIGPFNFPAHLPNGHIAPALAMGNTVVFKPSDKAPATGLALAELYREALAIEGGPPGAINVVQGGAGVASRLAGGEGVDGVLFTGSWPVGRRIIEANLDRPGRILALEMGGNNAAVILDDADLTQAVAECLRCAFISTGQRCTCTRRLIVQRAVADRVMATLVAGARELVVGDPEGNVFMGPMVSEAARDAVLAAQGSFRAQGGRVLLEAGAPGGDLDGWYITPGVMEVGRFERGEQGAGADVEVFGPLLRISVVDSLDAAIDQANATEFGLAAAVFTRDEAKAESFAARVRAGCINWNCGTAGASSKLPFGGLGMSGNHRPAGAFSVDYCAYPVASMIERGEGWTAAVGMGAIKV
ncbi:MAG: aldehyde dehydrogenase family protein [Phycisphaerales bacterium]